VKLYTIGFTKKNAQEFFETLRSANVRRVIDVRLNNVSQLSGFAKRDDLAYFLKRICDIEYVHIPELAPTQEILDKYKKEKGTWSEYAQAFDSLMAHRKSIQSLDPNLFDQGCLLCSESAPEFCHRRLLAEALQKRFADLQVDHLVSAREGVNR
jgi:uncharacterized protein (DUF488 family)